MSKQKPCFSPFCNRSSFQGKQPASPKKATGCKPPKQVPKQSVEQVVKQSIKRHEKLFGKL